MSWLFKNLGDNKIVQAMALVDKNGNQITDFNVDSNIRGYDRISDSDHIGLVTYSDATLHACTIQPKEGEDYYEFYIKGVKVRKTEAETIATPDITGTYYFYFNPNGIFSVSLQGNVDVTAFLTSAITGLAIYNKEQGYFYGAVDEQHGKDVPPSIHLDLHLTRGFKWEKGSGGEAIGFVDALSTFTSIGASRHWDEDIQVSIAELTTLPKMYLKTVDGVTGWAFTTADNNIGYIADGDTYVSYNKEISNGVWDLVESTSTTDYIIYLILATNLIDVPKMIVIGQDAYPSRSSARRALSNSLKSVELLGLPSAESEWQFAYICKRNGRLEDDGNGNAVVDLRGKNINSL